MVPGLVEFECKICDSSVAIEVNCYLFIFFNRIQKCIRFVRETDER